MMKIVWVNFKLAKARLQNMEYTHGVSVRE